MRTKMKALLFALALGVTTMTMSITWAGTHVALEESSGVYCFYEYVCTPWGCQYRYICY